MRDSAGFLWSAGQTKTEKEYAMSLSSHLQELRKKHENLSQQVEAASRNPATDQVEITQLKKQKLRLKEEITRLSQA